MCLLPHLPLEHTLELSGCPELSVSESWWWCKAWAAAECRDRSLGPGLGVLTTPRSLPTPTPTPPPARISVIMNLLRVAAVWGIALPTSSCTVITQPRTIALAPLERLDHHTRKDTATFINACVLASVLERLAIIETSDFCSTGGNTIDYPFVSSSWNKWLPDSLLFEKDCLLFLLIILFLFNDCRNSDNYK